MLEVKHRITFLIIGSLVLILSLYPESYPIAIAFIASASLTGWLFFLDKKEEDELSEFDKRIKEIDDKVSALTLGRFK